MDSKTSLGMSATVAVLQIGVFIYDVITYPFYSLMQRPWEKLSMSRRKRATILDRSDDHVTYKSETKLGTLQRQLKQEKTSTMVEILRHAVKAHGDLPVLGMRRLLEEKGEKQPDGRVFQKFVLGDYEWTSYNDLDAMSTAFGAGLINIGQQPRHNVVILAETRTEWLIAAYGCMKYNIPVVTLYSTLGEDAMAHGINETEVTHIVTSHDLLPKLKKVLANTPKVTDIIFMEHQLQKSNTDGYREGVRFTPFKEVIEKGKDDKIRADPPIASDIAIIMYTSGSTGTPKGVVLTHDNLVASLIGLSSQLDFYPDDVYMGFLPLAHVLELLAESVCLLVGVRIGYSSPLTITDTSSKIMRGTKGDATVLKPTIMASVPLILDRIYKAIIDKTDKGSAMQKAIFKFAYDYKRRWTTYGYSTPLLDKLLFSKIKAVLGGNLRGIAVGGAPLSPDTQEFIRTCLSCKVVQGYGLTETTAGATLQDWDDMNVSTVGAPLICCDVKLVSWEEGNYRVTDSPNPRGEIHIGGDNVSIGYYKNPDKTAEDFYQTLDSVNGGTQQWFKTGDIGEMLPEGLVRIIDRKKDLVKLQHGEYVSLGKVETELSTIPIVENICIYGDPNKLFTVALVVPNEKQLQATAAKLGVSGSFADLCSNEEVSNEILKDLQNHAKKSRLEKFEVPQALTLCSEMWTPDNSLVTAAFKLRRINIEKRYREDITRMYACSSG